MISINRYATFKVNYSGCIMGICVIPPKIIKNSQGVFIETSDKFVCKKAANLVTIGHCFFYLEIS